MNVTYESLLNRTELFSALSGAGISVGRRQFESWVPLLPYVLLPGQSRKRFRLNSVLTWLATLPEIQPEDERAESLHRRRRVHQSA